MLGPGFAEYFQIAAATAGQLLTAEGSFTQTPAHAPELWWARENGTGDGWV